MQMSGVIIFAVIVLVLLWLIDMRGRKIICPNAQCGYRGTGRATGGRSGCLLIVLLMLGLIPGLIYMLFTGKSGVCCPKCGMRIR